MSAIRYIRSADDITPDHLHGFFDGWPRRPSPQTHLRVLRRSDVIILAIDDSTGNVVGFITALTDGVLAAYIPFLEVLPAYRKRGIGSELMKRMLEQLSTLYMVDVLCDPGLQPFYEHFQMRRATGAMLRRYQRQDGAVL